MKRVRRQKVTKAHITYYLVLFIISTIILWPVYWIWAIPPFLPAILIVIFGPSFEESSGFFRKLFKKEKKV